jgi:hypothetical protein
VRENKAINAELAEPAETSDNAQRVLPFLRLSSFLKDAEPVMAAVDDAAMATSASRATALNAYVMNGPDVKTSTSIGVVE